MNKYRNLTFLTDEGELNVSRIENKVAYDQYNRKIDPYHFRLMQEILQEQWVNPNIQVKELAN